MSESDEELSDSGTGTDQSDSGSPSDSSDSDTIDSRVKGLETVQLTPN